MQLSVWQTNTLEEALRLGKHWPTRHWADVQHSVKVAAQAATQDDFLMMIVWVMGAMTVRGARAAAMVRSAVPNETALTRKVASDEELAGLAKQLLAYSEAHAKTTLASCEGATVGMWQDHQGSWWQLGGNGYFARCESRMAASMKELSEHYFGVDDE